MLVAFNASRADNVRVEYRVYEILERIREVTHNASTMEPPFHGESDGQVAEEIAEHLKRQWREGIR
eukprot:14519775-Heterocapsa_arctica.AAC.1